MTNRGIQRTVRKRMSRYQVRELPRIARLGDGNGTVQVPGRNNAVYVRPEGHDLPSVVTNYNVPNADGLQVYVERSNGRLVVTGPVDIDGWDPSYNPTIGPHAGNHTYGGPDVVYSSTKQIIELSVVPSSGLVVRVYGGIALTTTGAVAVLPTTLDLVGNVPVSGLRFVLIAVNLTTGAVVAKTGTNFALESYSLSYIPVPDAGTVGIAAIRLSAGQTSISNLYADPDILDLRFSPEPCNATYLQGVAVSAEAPDAGDVLFYDGSSWNPGTIISHEHVYQEDLSPQCDNSTVIMTTTQVFEANTTQVYLNGLLQSPANGYDNGDYAEDAGLQSITFVTAPLSSDSLFISYTISTNQVGS